MQKIDDGFWLTLGLYELNKSLALVDQRSPASRDDMTANQALVEFAFKKRRNKAKAQTRQHLLTCFQFAAREDCSKWARDGLPPLLDALAHAWHDRRDSPCKAFMHSEEENVSSRLDPSRLSFRFGVIAL